MLEAVLDLRAAEEIFRQIQPCTRRADVEVRRGRRLLYGQLALALNGLVEGHGVRRKHDVTRRAAGLTSLDARNRARGDGSARRRRDLTDRQGIRLDLDGEGIGSERADFVILFECDITAEPSELRRLDLARRLVCCGLCVDGECFAWVERQIAHEVDRVRL